jgi:hypothetical protein
MVLHPLDPVRTEDAVRAEHENQDHQHVGRKVLGTAADIGVEIASSDALHHAHDQPANHGAND